MKHNGIEYPFEIHPLSPEDGGGYAITFPDLPGCASDGATPEEALRNGRDAVESWLKVAREFGDVIPPPLSRASGKFVQRFPRSLHAQLITRAKAEGVSLNTLVVSLVAQGLGRRQGAAGKGSKVAKARSGRGAGAGTVGAILGQKSKGLTT